MRLNKETFDELATIFMELGRTYSTNAKLMIGGKGTPYPIHYETVNIDGKAVKLYNILYASIDDVVHPVAPGGIETALADRSKAMGVPKGHTASLLYALGIPHHCDKQLEVVAKEWHAIEGSSTLWDIYLLRHLGEEEGYLSDIIAKELLDKLKKPN